MPTAAWLCTVRSTPTARCSGYAGRSLRPEIDDAADDFTVEQVVVRFVDVVEAITPGDHLVEQQLTSLVEPGQPLDVGLGVAGPEYGARQRLVHQDEVLQVDLDRPGQLRGHPGEHAGPALAGQLHRIADVLGADQRRRHHNGIGHHPVCQTPHQVQRLRDRCGAVRRAELQCRLLFEFDRVDGDDLRGPVDPGALDGACADPTHADHHDGIAGPHVGAVGDGTVTG